MIKVLHVLTILFLTVSIANAAGNSSVTKGDAAYDNKNYSTAIEYYLPAAQQGDASVQMKVASSYVHLQNYSEAVKWYKVVAEKKSAKQAGAQWMLGVMYGQGKGVAQNMDLAYDYTRAAAKKGDEDAINFLRDRNVDINGHGDPFRRD
ncbi:MAG: tetratricopeptide repeat protein [Sideroxydans sp.]|nr:tetratricopeptide repeat protein [Sideroxydans sp.]